MSTFGDKVQAALGDKIKLTELRDDSYIPGVTLLTAKLRVYAQIGMDEQTMQSARDGAAESVAEFMKRHIRETVEQSGLPPQAGHVLVPVREWDDIKFFGLAIDHHGEIADAIRRVEASWLT